MRALLIALALLALPRSAEADCMGYHEVLLTPEVPAGTPLVLVTVYFGELPTELEAAARELPIEGLSHAGPSPPSARVELARP